MKTTAHLIRSLLTALALAMLALPSLAQQGTIEVSGAVSADAPARPSAFLNTKENRRYADKLSAKISNNLVWPDGIKANAPVVVRLTQQPSGQLLQLMLIQSSGSGKQDKAVMDAVIKSSPLPLPEGREPDRTIDIRFNP